MNRLKNIDGNRSKASSTRSYAAADATIDGFHVTPATRSAHGPFGRAGFLLAVIKTKSSLTSNAGDDGLVPRRPPRPARIWPVLG
jgi:hypothetical protein